MEEIIGEKLRCKGAELTETVDDLTFGKHNSQLRYEVENRFSLIQEGPGRPYRWRHWHS